MPTLDLDTFLDGLSSGEALHLAGLYDAWSADPKSVAPGWAGLFGALGNGGLPVAPPASGTGAGAAASAGAVRAATTDSIRALMLIRAYRVRGHLEATLDPLGITEIAPHAELDPATYGFGEADMDRPIFIDHVLGLESASLRQIVKILRETYCGSIGVEFMHIQSPEQKDWIQRRVEGAPWLSAFDAGAKRTILEDLTHAEGFETFCQKKYVGTKRFGIEGGESAIAAL
ncbi:MAG: 2-oxoglutarate dehydrogenase E1 component, partial [Acetobacteraceae bacterium]|nr:2-oxoglutarate dehydrogenase E1 component [Acetobacteraceae bacterium]